MSTLQRKVDELEKVINQNAIVLATCSAAVNLLCKKFGITTNELADYLEEEAKKSIERRNAESKQPGLSDDSRNQQPGICNPESKGNIINTENKRNFGSDWATGASQIPNDS